MDIYDCVVNDIDSPENTHMDDKTLVVLERRYGNYAHPLTAGANILSQQMHE